LQKGIEKKMISVCQDCIPNGKNIVKKLGFYKFTVKISNVYPASVDGKYMLGVHLYTY